MAIAFVLSTLHVSYNGGVFLGVGHNASQDMGEVSMWLGIINIHNNVFVSCRCTNLHLSSYS